MQGSVSAIADIGHSQHWCVAECAICSRSGMPTHEPLNYLRTSSLPCTRSVRGRGGEGAGLRKCFIPHPPPSQPSPGSALSSILWVKQLAIRLGCKRPQPSRWLSRLRERRRTRSTRYRLKEPGESLSNRQAEPANRKPQGQSGNG